ncbi:MAG: type Z 30S ribosomal protein S14 [Candidatus Levybacteria bacterium]|nr:type Z 30S ribosomal protein S14 [Candidatus Levybacteria bacterium]MDZ4227925.1 type Z 30S ribosomal protein S14 [Candidatus Levybacteria bacterium]
MAKKSNVVKLRRKQKFAVRNKSICNICGRSRAYMRRFGLCRLCFRELALKGQLPGVVKSSW